MCSSTIVFSLALLSDFWVVDCFCRVRPLHWTFLLHLSASFCSQLWAVLLSMQVLPCLLWRTSLWARAFLTLSSMYFLLWISSISSFSAGYFFGHCNRIFNTDSHVASLMCSCSVIMIYNYRRGHTKGKKGKGKGKQSNLRFRLVWSYYESIRILGTFSNDQIKGVKMTNQLNMIQNSRWTFLEGFHSIRKNKQAVAANSIQNFK